LRSIAERAAVLRFLALSATNAFPPDASVMAGVATICDDVERLARRVGLVGA